jgi:hypothetical protein
MIWEDFKSFLGIVGDSSKFDWFVVGTFEINAIGTKIKTIKHIVIPFLRTLES